MNAGPCFTDQFLIAMPSLDDPNFSHTVTYICEHNADGAMGIVINRPLDLQLEEMLVHLEIEVTDHRGTDTPVMLGGPVQQERGFVLHRLPRRWDATHPVSDRIGLTTSSDILAAIAHGEGPDGALISLGYAGWGGGQLEQELAENAWLNAPADPEILFDLPFEQRWAAAGALVGIDLATLSPEVGHA